MTACPQRQVRLLRDMACPVLHAKKRHRVTKIGRTRLIVGDLIERFEVGHQSHCLTRLAHRPCWFDAIDLDEARQQMWQRIIGVEFGDFLQFLQCAVWSSHPVIRDGEVQMRARVARLDDACTQQRIDCLVVVAKFEFKNAFAGQHDDVIGLNGERLLKSEQRVCILTRARLQRCQFTPGGCGFCIQLRGLFEVGAGDGDVVAFGFDHAQTQPGSRVFRRNLCRSRVSIDGLMCLSIEAGNVAKRDQSIYRHRVATQGFINLTPGIRCVVQLQR